jgi:hypothetical protein
MQIKRLFCLLLLANCTQLKRTANGLAPDMINSEKNLRVIPIGEVPETMGENPLSNQHSYRETLKEVYARWTTFFSAHPTPTKQQILTQAEKIEHVSLPPQGK